MKAIVVMFTAATLLFASGCAKQDWIDRTLVTVDVTGTWSGTMMAPGATGGAREVVLELEQKGSTVKGTMRVTPRGPGGPGTLEGTVAGDVLSFKDSRGTWEGELTISGEEMNGPVTAWGVAGALKGIITLRRADPPAPPASPPR